MGKLLKKKINWVIIKNQQIYGTESMRRSLILVIIIIFNLILSVYFLQRGSYLRSIWL